MENGERWGWRHFIHGLDCEGPCRACKGDESFSVGVEESAVSGVRPPRSLLSGLKSLVLGSAASRSPYSHPSSTLFSGDRHLHASFLGSLKPTTGLHRNIMTLSISLHFRTLKDHPSFRTPCWLAEALLQWILHVANPASFPLFHKGQFESSS